MIALVSSSCRGMEEEMRALGTLQGGPMPYYDPLPPPKSELSTAESMQARMRVISNDTNKQLLCPIKVLTWKI